MYSARQCLNIVLCILMGASLPCIYLIASYNLIATHKILRTPYLGAPLLGG